MQLDQAVILTKVVVVSQASLASQNHTIKVLVLVCNCALHFIFIICKSILMKNYIKQWGNMSEKRVLHGQNSACVDADVR